jgi:hypothetical protein
MRTAKGYLQSISTTLKRLAQNGDVDRLGGYVRSDVFLTAPNGLDPERQSSVMRSFVKAEALCEAKARHPLIEPKRIDAKRAEKVAWSNPIMRTKLTSAYARAGGDDEIAARILGVTVGSARLARRRYLSETANSCGGSQEAQESPFAPRTLPPYPDSTIASVTRCQAAFWPT